MIVSGVDAGADLIPVLPFVFVAVFLLVDHNFTPDDPVGLFVVLGVVKGGFPLFQIRNPPPHVFGIGPERVIDILAINFAPF